MTAPLVGRRVGAFEVEGLIGAGGMSEVYHACDTRLGRGVALKVLPAEVAGDPDRLARFEREARLVAALSHPNILTLYEVGSEGAISYAAFELLEGETLRKRLAPGPLAVRPAVEIAALVARGLAAAHARGIVHRDLKPDNVFLTRDGGVKILDFGLARVEEEAWPAWSQDATKDQLTDAGAVLGTVGYMSPEQVRGEEAGPRSDIFALGCVLYEMLGGRRPFTGASRAETLAAVLHQEPTPLPALDTQPGVDRLMRRCLQKDPARRFQSADDLAFALEGLSSPSGSGELLGGGRRPGSRGSRWPRAAAMIAGLALLAASIVAGRWLAQPAPPAAAPTFERVSFRRGSIFQARFTSDGRSVLYSAAFEGGPPEVYETRLGNPDSRPLGLAPASLLAVSPSGELAVVRQPAMLTTFHHPGRLAVLSSAGATPRDVAELVSTADWTPDGRELVIVRRASANEFPSRALLEWPIGVTLYETANMVSSLRVSPRADRVAFFEYGSQVELVIVDRKGSRTSLGGGWDYLTGGLAWRPDGRSLWATVLEKDAASRHPRLVEVGLDSSHRGVLELPGGVRLHDVSADGRVLVSQPNVRVSLYAGGLASVRDKDLSWFGTSMLNSLSTDGSRVLFTDRPSPSATLYSLFQRPRDGGPAVRLVDGVSQVGARLSPDGRWVAAARGWAALRLDSTGTGAAPELPPSGFRWNTAWAWLPDSTGLVVAGTRDDGSRGLVELGLSGAAPRPLAGACPGGDVVISPDARRVACGTHPAMGRAVFIHARDGSGSRQLTTSEPAGNLLRWSADGRSLFSHRPADMPAAILRTDLATGRVEVVRTVMPPDPTGVWAVRPIAVTADGRAWAYSAVSWLGDLYVYSGLR